MGQLRKASGIKESRGVALPVVSSKIGIFKCIQTLLYSPYGYTRVVEIRKIKGYPDIAGGDLKETLKTSRKM